MGGLDEISDMKVPDFSRSQFEVNSCLVVVTSIQKLDSRKDRQFNAPLHQFVQIGPDMSVGTR